MGAGAPVRSDALPDVPALGEFVPGYEASGWQDIGGPKWHPMSLKNWDDRSLFAAIEGISRDHRS
jgi:hypothetical protein